MSSLHALLRLAAWLILLLAMILGGFQRYYLTGWNQPMLAVTCAGLALLFTAGLLEKPRGTREDRGIGAWSETLAHYLPLILFLAVGPTLPAMNRLSNFDYTGRKASGIAPRMDGGPLSVSLLDLHAQHERLDGHPVEVIGTAHLLSESERKNLPASAEGRDIRAILYRYAITCCAADATTVSAVLNDIDPKAIQEDRWYKVRGRSRYVAEGLNVPFVAVESLEPIPQPLSPYLTGSEEVFR